MLFRVGSMNKCRCFDVIHISHILFLILFYGGNMIVPFTFMDNPIDAVGIALFHTIFNIGTTVLNGGVSMVVFFVVNKIVFSDDKETSKELIENEEEI